MECRRDGAAHPSTRSLGTGIAITTIGVGLIVGPMLGFASKDYSEETDPEDDNVDEGGGYVGEVMGDAAVLGICVTIGAFVAGSGIFLLIAGIIRNRRAKRVMAKQLSKTIQLQTLDFLAQKNQTICRCRHDF